MAVRSIISVDVQDSAFREFQRLFERYQTALKSTPAAWAMVTKNIDGSRASFNKLVAELVAANAQTKLMAQAQERADQLTRSWTERWRASRSMAEHWQSMARSTKEFAAHIGQATSSLLRWGTITGAISGLLGAGGIWGLDRLAAGVSERRRSALGLGTDIGGQEAFKANVSRFVDPESFLSSVAGAKFDVTRRVGLMAAGLSPGQIAGDTTQTAVALLREAKRIADSTNPALFAQMLQARRLDQFFAPTDLMRLRGTSPAEFERVVGRVGARRGGLAIPGDVAERWQELTTQLSNAGSSINAVLVRGLANLAGPLSHLSESVVKAIKAFMESPTLGRWIKLAGDALERFAGYIGTPEFAHQIESFVEGLGKIAKAIGNAVAWIAGAIGETAGPAAAADRSNMVGGAQSLRREREAGRASALGQLGDVFMRRGPVTNWQNFLQGLSYLETSHKGDPSRTSSAKGFFQFTDPTARQAVGAGLPNPQTGNFTAQANATQAFIRRFHPEAAAAIDRGDFDTAATLLRGRWPSLPGGSQPQSPGRYETWKQELQGGGPRAAPYAQPPPIVTIENNTGGNANVSVNGLKQ